MDPSRSSLVVVADGRRARLFEERRRGGELHEITDLFGDLAIPRPPAAGVRAQVHDRFGPASHAIGDETPKDQVEARFVDLVGARSAEILRRGGYDDLILVAAPRALGRLRRAVQHAGVTATLAEAHDRVTGTADELRTNLRDLRLRG
jgi:protein required for attachment to host cells